MTLPVSVVVPHKKSRKWFFERFGFPSIQGNEPAEIIVEDGEGTAPEKRNRGASKTTQPFLIFVDDDTILGKDCLKTMLDVLERTPDVGYSYSDHLIFVWPGVKHPGASIQEIVSKPFDPGELKRANFADTTSLMRKNVFPGFDETLHRFQDWDLWLTMLSKGVRGVYIPGVLFFKFHVDQGITASFPMDIATWMVRRKHGLQ